MKQKSNERSARKKYAKPQLRVVSIAPGTQTLGIGCKMVASGTSYNQPCVSRSCATEPGS